MTDLPPIANFISNCLLILLIITFIYALCIRFVTDVTLYDLTILPSGDPRKLSYCIEPPPTLEEPLLFPSVFDPPDLSLSLIIPTVDCESTLPTVIDAALAYLRSRALSDSTFHWEIIVADDASSDRTADIVVAYGRECSQIRLLRQPSSLGKGACVQAGCLHCRGRLVLVADADPGVKFEEVGVLERRIKELQGPEAVVFGTRAHLAGFGGVDGGAAQKLMAAAGARGARETQFCLKLFSREAAQWIFPNQHTALWCWDPELLAIAGRKKMAVDIVPIEYGGEPQGAGLLSGIKEVIDLVQIALFYRLGLWTIRMKADVRPPTSEV
jgi:dolichyl-phosphate beta-glucosyltransferase